MPFQFFGKRGDAFFDVWTLVHLAFWFVVGANMEQLTWPQWIRWSIIGIGAITWEFVETWLDLKTDMEMTKESFANRWVSDPIMAFVGAFLGMLAIGMSPITRVVRSTKLTETQRIDIVRQNGDREIILSIVEEDGCVQDRKTVRIELRKAQKIARDLAGIASQAGMEDDDLD